MFEIKEDLTVDNILNRIDEYSIFRSYCSNFKEIDKPFKSEFRDESVPSCRIVYKNKRLWYKDFGVSDKALDCFGYIMKKYGMSFRQALGIVNMDFSLGLKQEELIRPSLNLFGFPDKVELTEKKDTEIQVKYRNWTKKDVEFWRDTFHIEKNTLDLYQTSPIKYLFINGKFIIAPELSYASLIDIEDSKPIYKIYSPFSALYKWLSNCKSHHYLGHNQLPWLGEILIVTKSLKDVMELYQFGYNSIAPQSESWLPTWEILQSLQKRFPKVILFFDNDDPGIKSADKICSEHNIPRITLPDGEPKDISDYVRSYGVEQGKKIMEELMQKV